MTTLVDVSPLLAAAAPDRKAPSPRRLWIDIAILGLALFLRLFLLAMKPAHFDEGVNGWFVDEMTKNGYYHYDPTNFHGPFHFYILFIAQTLLGRHIWALRLPLVLASTASVWVVLSLRHWLGERTCQVAAMAMAVSPAMTFYGRYAIHESWMLLSLLLIFRGGLGLWRRGERIDLWTLLAGVTGCILTKETYAIHFAALLLAIPTLMALELITGPGEPAVPQRWTRMDAAIGGVVGLWVIIFFYSGGFLDGSSLPGLWLTFREWFTTGTSGASGHEKLWHYWLEMMERYELPTAVGLVAAVWVGLLERRRPLRLLAIWGCGVLTAFSIIRYKTPWCILSLMWPFLFLFADGIARLARKVDPWVAGALGVAVLGHSIHNSYLLNFWNETDENEPYVYVQTLPAIHHLLDPLNAIVARNPASIHLSGKILFPTGDSHPLPWLLGDYTGVEFLEEKKAPKEMDADFLLIADAFVSDVEDRLTERYFRQPITLRGNSGDSSNLYFREATFGWYFDGRRPEFTPHAKAGEEGKMTNDK